MDDLEIEDEAQASDLFEFIKGRLSKKLEKSRTVLEKFYAHGSPDEIFREDLLSAKTGLEVVFEKLLLHALDTSHLIDESNHQEILDTVGDTKNEVEFMICEINDAIMYLEEASAKSKKSSE